MLMTIVIYETGTDYSGNTHFLSLGTHGSQNNEGLMRQKYGEFLEFCNPSAKTETTLTKGTTSIPLYINKQMSKLYLKIQDAHPLQSTFLIQAFSDVKLKRWQNRAIEK